MAQSSQVSSTSSPMYPDQIGDYRLMVPFQMRPVAYRCAALVWYDDSDRQALAQMQHYSKGAPVSVREESAEYAPRAMTEMALAWIRLRYDMKARHRARHLFAAAAHRQARRFLIQRQLDMLVVYAGLVKGYAKSPETPLVVLAIIGGLLADEAIIASVHAPECAENIATGICTAIANAFPSLATIPGDLGD